MEKRKFIAGAIKHPGALHSALGIPLGKKIPDDVLERASHQSGHLGQMARLARTLKTLGR